MTHRRDADGVRWQRHAAIFAASLVSGAFEGAHTFAWTGRINPWCVAFVAVGVLIELEALTGAFYLGVRNRSTSTWSFALASVIAVGVGVAESLGGWVIQNRFDVPVLGRMHAGVGTVLELGTFNGLVGLGFWAVAVVVPFAVRDANTRAREAEQLRTAAELARLRANLQPHFLLNTLSTVAGLVTEDPAAAREVVAALGDLLRDSVEEAEETQTLEDELRWLRRYADILETRHRGSLTFRWDIADASRGARIPRLLLQPLLENAVKHGALRRPEGGEVAVRATITGEPTRRITCIVEDNGPGLVPRNGRPGGRGIDLVTRRLALRYAGAATFRLESSEGRTRSIVEFPVEAAP